MDIPHYRVTMLGDRKSGKTVFLAAMHYALVSETRDRPFLMTATSHAERNFLNKTFFKIADPRSDWPPSTLVTRPYEFILRVRVPRGEVFDVMKLSYLDYRGESLGDVTEDAETLFAEHIKKSDMFFCVLDGLKILRVLDGTARVGDLLAELHGQISIVEDSRADAPCDILVTKWDLIQEWDRARREKGARDQLTPLAIIHDQLMSLDRVRHFVAGRVEREAPVRLIPVSAVGQGYAVLDEDTGIMRKVGHEPRPFQVELPLASIVPTRLEQLRKQLDREVSNRTSQRPIAVRMAELLPHREALEATVTALIRAWGQRQITPRGKAVAVSADRMTSTIVDMVDRWRDRTITNHRERLGSVRDQHEAVAFLYDNFATMLAQFERENPASMLSESW
jgi:hypothetical protein